MNNVIAANDHSMLPTSSDLQAQQPGQKMQKIDEQKTFSHHHCPVCNGHCVEKTKKKSEENQVAEI